MTITRITNNDNAQYVEYIARSLEETFRRIEATEACIIANFPQISNTPIDFFIWINVPFGHGGYRAGNAEKIQDRPYLNNMAFTIRILETPKLAAVHGSTIFKQTEGEIAELDIFAERHNDQNEIERFIKERTGIKYLYCPEVIWLKGYKSSDLETSDRNRMIFFDDTIFKMEGVINNVADEIIAISNHTTGFRSFPSTTDDGNAINMSSLINNVIEAANEGSKYGILTKKKLSAITRLVGATRKVLEAQKGEEKFCLITGKPGTGKTLALSRVIYEIARNGHHARFLTYNQMLAIDMKQTLRALSLKVNIEKKQRLDSSNVTCQTIHKFFFDLAKKFNILELVTEGRVKELQDVCSTRINLAKQILFEYYDIHNNELPSKNINLFTETERGKTIPPSNRKEIQTCLDSILWNWKMNKQLANITIEKRKELIEVEFENYKHRRFTSIENYAIKDAFRSDYYKVLEILYAQIVQPIEFLHRKKTMSRNNFLRWVSEANPNATDYDIYSSEVNEREIAETQEQIKSAKRKINWSNTIFIDEGQDCNYYEKLIIQHLIGNKNLVVASGGSDQLIRTPSIVDWTRTFGGAKLKYLPIKLGKRSHRQKSNIVNFANKFAQLNNYSLEMDIDPELEGVGNIIIDTRPSEKGYIPQDITDELKNNGTLLGYSQYESLLFLLPIRGEYVNRTSRGTSIQIDEYDNATEEEDYFRQTLNSSVGNIDMWAGVGDAKYKSQFPQHNQSRFIYYESCRGLEACNVLCLDLDIFYQQKMFSKEADRYVNLKQDLFTPEEELRKRFVTTWCTMILTRAIDTLYIKIKDKNTEFSKTILQAARETPGTRILE